MEQTTHKKRGGRSGRKLLRAASSHDFSPFIKRNIPYYPMFTDEQLGIIEHNADTILQEIGIEFQDDQDALDMLRKAGADVQGSRVRFPLGMCRQIIQASAPKTYVQHARNAQRNITIGGNNTVLVPAYGSPFVRNLDEGRRYATLADFENFVKLAYMAPGLHHSGGTLCEPVDIPVAHRHLNMVYSHIKYSDKPFMGSVTSAQNAADTVKLAGLVMGEEFVENNTVITSLINANSPMKFDDTMLGAARVYAQHNQATVISPFILSGAMSPVTVVATLTQILAEAMAGMTFVQLVRPGAPVIFGTFASSMSMLSGAPTFGTPEPVLVLYGAAQLARRLGVPFRSGGGLCASKIPDAQAAYEAANTLQHAALAGVNFMLHTAGWLEGGLSMCYEKFIMDCDQASMIERILKGPDFSENGQGLSAMREVEPGAHYLGCQHTLENFETAFYNSIVADNNSFEQWQEDGSQDNNQRANTLWKKWLNEYEPPALDPAIDESLLDFIAQRADSTK